MADTTTDFSDIIDDNGMLISKSGKAEKGIAAAARRKKLEHETSNEANRVPVPDSDTDDIDGDEGGGLSKGEDMEKFMLTPEQRAKIAKEREEERKPKGVPDPAGPPIQTGPDGGKYIMVGGKKKYLTEKEIQSAAARGHGMVAKKSLEGLEALNDLVKAKAPGSGGKPPKSPQVIGIGKKGGKIIGYDSKGKPLYLTEGKSGRPNKPVGMHAGKPSEGQKKTYAEKGAAALIEESANNVVYSQPHKQGHIIQATDASAKGVAKAGFHVTKVHEIGNDPDTGEPMGSFYYVEAGAELKTAKPYTSTDSSAGAGKQKNLRVTFVTKTGDEVVEMHADKTDVSLRSKALGWLVKDVVDESESEVESEMSPAEAAAAERQAAKETKIIAAAESVGVTPLSMEGVGIEFGPEDAAKLKEMGYKHLGSLSSGNFSTNETYFTQWAETYSPPDQPYKGAITPDTVKVGQKIGGNFVVTSKTAKTVTIGLAPGGPDIGPKFSGKKLIYKWDGRGFKRQGQYLTEEGAKTIQKSGLGGLDDWMEKAGDISPEKARQILHDGEVHGKPITEQQRKYFGAIGGHLPAPGKAKKSEGGMDDGKPGESLEETSTSELKSTFKDIKARLEDNPDDAKMLQARLKAISSELGKRGIKKSIDSLDALEDYLEKGVTPAGGMTPGGYKKVPDGKGGYQYVKPGESQEGQKKEGEQSASLETTAQMLDLAIEKQNGDSVVKALNQLIRIAKNQKGMKGKVLTELRSQLKSARSVAKTMVGRVEADRRRSTPVKGREPWTHAHLNKARDIRDAVDKAREIVSNMGKSDKTKKKEATSATNQKIKYRNNKINAASDAIGEYFSGKRSSMGIAAAVSDAAQAHRELAHIYKGTGDEGKAAHHQEMAEKTKTALGLLRGQQKMDKQKAENLLKEVAGMEVEPPSAMKVAEEHGQTTMFGVKTEKSMSEAIDILEDYLEKGETPIGGITPKGYMKIKTKSGKVQYVKPDSKEAKEAMTAAGKKQMAGKYPKSEGGKKKSELVAGAVSALKESNVGALPAYIDSLTEGERSDLKAAISTPAAKDKAPKEVLDKISSALGGGKESGAKTDGKSHTTWDGKEIKPGMKAKFAGYDVEVTELKPATSSDPYPRVTYKQSNGITDSAYAYELNQPRGVYGPPETEKSMSGIEELGEYLEKAGCAMPTHEPKMGAPKSMVVDGGSQDGGGLEGTGKTSGTNTSKATPGTDGQGGVMGATTGKGKFSADDAEDEDQMKPHKKPIETTRKSIDPAAQRDMTSHERAVLVSRLRKGEPDLTIGGAPRPYTHLSHSVDEEAAELAKGGNFYDGPSPAVARKAPLIEQGVMCKSCESGFSAALTACPHCGDGVVQHRGAMPGSASLGGHMVIEKSTDAPGLRPPRQEADLVLPNGVTSEEE